MLLQPPPSESTNREPTAAPAEKECPPLNGVPQVSPQAVEVSAPPRRKLVQRLHAAGRQALVEAEATAIRWAFAAGAAGSVLGVFLAIIGIFMRGRFMGWHIVGLFAVVVEAVAGMVLGGVFGWVGGGLVGGIRGLAKGFLG